MTLSPKAQAFLARNPTLLDTINGDRFYEHLTLGDEGTLICITREGKKFITDFIEVPSLDEYLDWCKEGH